MSATKSDIKLHIDKLEDASGWPKWKWQMEMLFVQNKLTGIVHGSDQCPVVGEQASADQLSKYDEWVTSNAAACNYIMGTLGNNFVDLVLSTNTASAMWSKLIARFERTSTQRRDRLFQELFNMSPTSSEDVAQFIARVTNTFSNLNAELKRGARNELDESVLIARILTALGHDTRYEDFWTVWECVPENQQKIDLLTEKLCAIELRKFDNCTDSASAFVTKTTNSKSNVSNKNEKVGSVSNKKRQQYISDQKKKKPCHKCGKLGHWAAECTSSNSNGKFSKMDNHKRESGFMVHDASIFNKQDVWICDSGASQHITSNKEFFASYEKFVPPKMIRIAKSKDFILAYGYGRIDIEVLVHNKWQRSHLNDVWYVPDSEQNLLSVSRSTDLGHDVTFNRNSVVFRRNGQVTMTGQKIGRAYILNLRMNKPEAEAHVNFATNEENLQIWHERMAHINKQQVKSVLKRMGIDLSAIDGEFCDGCVLGKAHRLPFGTRTHRATSICEKIHADVMGPTENASFAGKHYYVCFKDDFSKYRMLYFMKHKSEVATHLKAFINETKAYGHTIKILRTDGGGEFDNDQIRTILAANGIMAEITPPYTPQLNGVAERENRTIVELARSMLASSGLPKICWAEACATAVHVLNRAGKSSVPNKSPIELWRDKEYGSLEYLRIFGTECFVHIPKQKRHKFDSKAIKGKVVGYLNDRDGYRVYLPSKHQVVCSRDVVFKPERMCSTSVSKIELSVSSPQVSEEENEENVSVERINDSILTENVSNQEEKVPSQRTRNPEERYRPKKFDDYCVYSATDEFVFSAVEFVDSVHPRSYQEAVSSEYSENWQIAMNEEIQSHYENNTWELVQKPAGIKLLDGRWVYRTKIDVNGSPRFKARFVVKGYAQTQGIDYDETYSPVARYDTVRAVLAVAAADHLKLQQFDIKTAFLYGELQEEVYVKQPEGFEDNTDRVCRLKKSVYGLKQAPRSWNAKFVSFMQSSGMQQSKADPCLFTRNQNGKKLFIAIYVDDGLMAGSDIHEINAFMNDLKNSFKITSGELNNFLGMQIVQNSDSSIFISQSGYTEKMLKRFNMNNSNKVATPCDRTECNDSKPIESQVPYREAIGCLMYLTAGTRPDIAYAVSKAARSMESPTQNDWTMVKRIFKYLRGTSTYGILYKIDGSTLQVYSDADFGGCSKTRRSTTGVISIISGGAVSWTSQLQRSVALSTTEAEFVASSEGTKELIWLQRLLSELGHRVEKPTLFIDSASALKLTKNPEFHKRTKHIDVRYFFVREKYLDGVVDVQHVSSDMNLADILTKPLDRGKFTELRHGISVTTISVCE